MESSVFGLESQCESLTWQTGSLDNWVRVRFVYVRWSLHRSVSSTDLVGWSRLPYLLSRNPPPRAPRCTDVPGRCVPSRCSLGREPHRNHLYCWEEVPGRGWNYLYTSKTSFLRDPLGKNNVILKREIALTKVRTLTLPSRHAQVLSARLRVVHYATGVLLPTDAGRLYVPCARKWGLCGRHVV